MITYQDIYRLIEPYQERLFMGDRSGVRLLVSGLRPISIIRRSIEDGNAAVEEFSEGLDGDDTPFVAVGSLLGS